MKKARIFLAAAAFVFVLLLAGCGKDSEPQREDTGSGEQEMSEEGVRIGMSFDSFVIERWIRDRDVFVSSARELGAEVNVQNSNGDIEEQISQIRYLIDKEVDVLVIIAGDCSALTDVMQEARDKGIKTISYDRLILNAPCDLYVTFDNEMVGTLMARALKESIPGGGEIFMIQGPEEDNNVALVRSGFLAEIEDSNLDIVYTAGCEGWRSELAEDFVREGLAAHPGVKGIMCGNDDIATQVIRVLSEEQMAGEVMVVGQDGDLAACQRIVEGTQTMTAFKSVESLAQEAAGYAVAMAKGEMDVREEETLDTMENGYEDVPTLLLTPVAVMKSNMKQVIIDGGVHSLEDVYLNVRAGR
ncbi:MAG: substrate-binding domain-containing protein [Blautia sp.]|nr:substrate-binding domain-containing protein [Blautia sp.]